MSRRTDSDAPTITAAYPRLLLGLLEERGLDGRALLRKSVCRRCDWKSRKHASHRSSTRRSPPRRSR